MKLRPSLVCVVALLLSVPAFSAESLLELVTSDEGRAALRALTKSDESLNRVTLLHLGKTSRPERLEVLQGATHTVYMDVPYWFSDTEGKLTYEVLSEKISENPALDMRVMFDWFTPAQSDDFWGKGMVRDLLKLTGGNLQMWNPPKWGQRWSGLLLKNHMHDKMIVVDNQTLIMGGMNIADTYLHGGVTSEGWHDTDIRIDGPAAADASEIFLKTWELTKYLSGHIHKPLPSSRKRFRKMLQSFYYDDKLEHTFRMHGLKFKAHFPLEDELAELERVKRETANPEYKTSVRLIYDNPLFEPASKTRQTLAYLLKNAKERVRLFSPYITITDEMEDVLVEAAKRVPVEIITNSAIAHDLGKIPFTAAVSHYPRLMDAGVKIYEWQGHKPLKELENKHGCAIPDGEWPGNTLHTKSVMVDGVVTLLGSHNMNTRSERMNIELMALMVDPEITAQMENVFLTDLDLGEERLVPCGDQLLERPRRVQPVDRKAVDKFLKKNAAKVKVFRRLQTMM